MDSKWVSATIKNLCPQAPPIGRRARVYLGVAKTDGRWHHTCVRGPKDTAVACRVIGYRIEQGYACGVWPLNKHTVCLLVRVKLDDTIAFHDRIVDCHVTCLECVPSQLSKPA